VVGRKEYQIEVPTQLSVLKSIVQHGEVSTQSNGLGDPAKAAAGDDHRDLWMPSSVEEDFIFPVSA
jgi:hypothetical protein